MSLLERPNHQTRVRKEHRKSRYGCANCKVRRVKCDETKPECGKCVSHGLKCSFEAGTQMQLAFAGAFKVDLGPSPGPGARAIPIPRAVQPVPIWLPLAKEKGIAMYEMKRHDMALLSRFQHTNILTVGPKDLSLLFQQEIIKEAIANPFLMHMVLALTLIHDIHSASASDRRKTVALAYHYFHGTTLFNKKLSRPIDPHERDALWPAAALTATSAFADITATRMDESWPLTPPSADDLSWLKLTSGKQAIIELSNPIRKQGTSGRVPITSTLAQFIQPTANVGDEVFNLPPIFIELYGLDEFSTPTSNPYHTAATLLAQIIPLEINRNTVSKFLSFVGFPDPRYVRLLADRDPSAMLLLLYWYAKALSLDQWWIWRRAHLEGPAMCDFLAKEFSTKPEMLELLEYPKAVFSL
ncbi:hypothetical protein B0H67DRAFT_547011 [Lasiosphaeris hirsuta]|uniref:Zn(2)-C6 fungal-type domain-containing protein n=1 Tax=Lasiosphaeris hirsuta TaxID=260670 RepID=A0AA39ZSG2_9PEZI|nr:hypothetical protein B0H67DRAFT_547011 [Lasiosphaeris hirsuta]